MFRYSPIWIFFKFSALELRISFAKFFLNIVLIILVIIQLEMQFCFRGRKEGLSKVEIKEIFHFILTLDFIRVFLPFEKNPGSRSWAWLDHVKRFAKPAFSLKRVPRDYHIFRFISFQQSDPFPPNKRNLAGETEFSLKW